MAFKFVLKNYTYIRKDQNKIIVKTRKYVVIMKIYHISKVTALVRRQLHTHRTFNCPADPLL